MYFHPEAKMVYLAHPRTASVSTATALQKVGFIKWCGDHHLRLWVYSPPRCSPELPNPVPAGSPLVTPETRDQWTVFTTIRNHYDAAVSWVFKRFKGRDIVWDVGAFETALKYNGYVEDNRMWGLHSDDADVILRFETLGRDLSELLAKHHVPIPTLIPHNVSDARKGKPYQEFYTAESRKYVEERFGLEIQQFGYRFEEN